MGTLIGKILRIVQLKKLTESDFWARAKVYVKEQDRSTQVMIAAAVAVLAVWYLLS